MYTLMIYFKHLSHRFGFKMPKGGGVLRNPYKAIYNRVYNYVAKKLF